jgi:hypothetical protein
MEMKGLSLGEVSHSSGVSYSTCSWILRGRIIDPAKLAAIRTAIEAAPTPTEKVVA